ncbi:AAA ATPase midasin, partial [Bulinus truncatus]
VKYFCTEYKPSLEDSVSCLKIGRASLQKQKQNFQSKPTPTFSYTRASVVLLEKVAVCIQRNEPVLLCGETGTGKTSTVHFLAHHLGHRLHVINLNQQSDSTDLLGGCSHDTCMLPFVVSVTVCKPRLQSIPQHSLQQHSLKPDGI